MDEILKYRHIILKIVVEVKLKADEVRKITSFTYHNFPSLTIGKVEDHYQIVNKRFRPEFLETYETKEELWKVFYFDKSGVFLLNFNHKIVDGASLAYIMYHVTVLSKAVLSENKINPKLNINLEDRIHEFGDNHIYHGRIYNVHRLKSYTREHGLKINDILLAYLSYLNVCDSCLGSMTTAFPNINLGNHVSGYSLPLVKFEGMKTFQHYSSIMKINKLIHLNPVLTPNHLLKVANRIFGPQNMAEWLSSLSYGDKPVFHMSNMNMGEKSYLGSDVIAKFIPYVNLNRKNLIWICFVTYGDYIYVNLTFDKSLKSKIPNLEQMRESFEKMLELA